MRDSLPSSVRPADVTGRPFARSEEQKPSRRLCWRALTALALVALACAALLFWLNG